MSGGYSWIRVKGCSKLVEMEKGRLKRELISEFLDDLISLNEFPSSIPYIFEPLRKLKEKWEGKLK